MAGIVKETNELIVTGGGGGGGNVTVTGPLGSRPAAQSVSVALANDQIPLPVTDAGPADIQVLAPVTFTSGSGSPAAFAIPGPGTLFLFLHGTWNGNIAVAEQYTTGGSFASSQGYFIPTIGLSNAKQSWQNWFGQFGFQATDFISAVTSKGIAIQITNNLASGSVVISALYKRNDEGVKPAVIAGAVQGFGADVNNNNELNVTRVGQNSQWVISPTSDNISPGSNVVPVDLNVQYVWNGVTFDRMPGDRTNGIRIQGTANLPISNTTWNSGTAVNSVVNQATPGMQSVVCILIHSGSSTGGAITVDGSFDGGSNWAPIPATLSDANVPTPIYSPLSIPLYLNGSTIRLLFIDCGGLSNVRVRLSSAITGADSLIVALGANAGVGANYKAEPAVMFGNSGSIPGTLVIPTINNGALLVDPSGGAGSLFVSQGDPNTADQAWPVEVTGFDTGLGLKTAVNAKSSAPLGTEEGLIVRNIPSGIQQVSLASNASNPILVAQDSSLDDEVAKYRARQNELQVLYEAAGQSFLNEENVSARYGFMEIR